MEKINIEFTKEELKEVERWGDHTLPKYTVYAYDEQKAAERAMQKIRDGLK